MSKKKLLPILFLGLLQNAFAQKANYWQQKVDYKIQVSLNDTAKTLDGYINIQYTNQSQDTLRYIWFHLWPNAYKNDQTAFSDQLLENGRTDFYFSDEEKRGYINRLNFKVNHTLAVTEDHPQHQDIIKVLLPQPLLPGSTVLIETPFHEKLPFNFSRGGYIGQSFQITQWYPKPAVYDAKGWHEMPYLDQGEFYSEFGNYDVNIQLPLEYKVAATGKLKDSTILNNEKSLHYLQNNIHDFAWFADKDFQIDYDTLQLKSKIIEVYSYHYDNKIKNNSEIDPVFKDELAYIKNAILTKSNWLGEYPYDIVSVVESKTPGGGGMEYPTITLIDKANSKKELDDIINHEVGHNWFYGILASNERTHPWMDEGMNSYYDNLYSRSKINLISKKDASFFDKRFSDDMEDVLLQTIIKEKTDQPIETSSENFSSLNYDLIAYKKTAEWMQLVETRLGKASFDRMMQSYYNTWKFKHPYPEDFKKIASEFLKENTDSIFSLLLKKGSLMPPSKKTFKAMSFFSLKDGDKHNYLFFSPAVGYNYYDKLMLGGIIHNYTLPLNNFQFLAIPLYSFSSKKLNGLGRVSYSVYPQNSIRKIEFAIAGASFSNDLYIDAANVKNNLRYKKWVPSIKFIFANKNPRSSVTSYLQWKTYFIEETGLEFFSDTTQQFDIVTYPKNKTTINQLRFVVSNDRKLYPYKALLEAQQGKGFAKLNLTANYFFNYAKEGGLSVRLFAGKFFYTTSKTYSSYYETGRYHYNMSGANGYEDYTYDNYFIGRNKFEGFSSQQLMIKDGGFKVHTDLLSDKIGKTDNWLTAINLSTSIPKNINPLEMLPFKIPLKIFVDIGTYADAWQKNHTTGRFIYDAGLQLSLCKNLINIYLPITYSKVYRDYFKSTVLEKIFIKNISFSIDLQNFSLKKIIPQIPF